MSGLGFEIMPKTMPRLVIGGRIVPQNRDHRRWPGRGGGGLHRHPARCRMDAAMKRSVAPVFWLLFGAGGMLAALTGPALVLITGLAAPTGIGLSPELHVVRARGFVRPKPIWQAHPVRHNRFVYLARRRAHLSDAARHACRRQVGADVDLLWHRWRADCCYLRGLDDHWSSA